MANESSKWPWYVGGGIAVASIAGAIAYTVGRKRASHEFQRQLNTPPGIPDLLNPYDPNRGGAGVGISDGNYWVPPSVTPSVGPPPPPTLTVITSGSSLNGRLGAQGGSPNVGLHLTPHP